MEDLFAILGSTLVLGAVMALIVIPLNSSTCHSQWDSSGAKAVSYGPIKGCMVQLPDGRWLPADNLRDLDITGNKRP